MTRSRKAHESRDFIAYKSRLLARMMARDSETSLAMEAITMAVLVGADIVRVAEKTGYAVDQIRPLERRLREALIWDGRRVDAREWIDETTDRYRMMAIQVQAYVATGVLKRELVDGGAAYSDLEGNELIRFRISPESRILFRFPPPRVGIELSDLQLHRDEWERRIS